MSSMLLDRVCVGGGWNSGNSVVYGAPLPAHVEATAIALLALQDEERTPAIQASLAWLKGRSASIESVESLAWCILTLFLYQEPVGHLQARLAKLIGDGRGIREQCHSRHRNSRPEMRRDDSSVRGAAMNIDQTTFRRLGGWEWLRQQALAAEWLWPKHSMSYQRPRSFVAILNAAEYSEKVEALLMDGLRLFRLNLLGKTVLLKPNLVEDLPGPVNTNAEHYRSGRTMLPSTGRDQGGDRRGAWPSTGHRTCGAGRESETSSRGARRSSSSTSIATNS